MALAATADHVADTQLGGYIRLDNHHAIISTLALNQLDSFRPNGFW